jgi:hypothetical protein
MGRRAIYHTESDRKIGKYQRNKNYREKKLIGNQEPGLGMEEKTRQLTNSNDITHRHDLNDDIDIEQHENRETAAEMMGIHTRSTHQTESHESYDQNTSCIHHIHDKTLILAIINSEQDITSTYPEPFGMSDPEYDNDFGNKQMFGMIQRT